MDQKTFASMIVKYWYFIEFMGQPDFPSQSREGRALCLRVAKGKTNSRQITVYHTLSSGSGSAKGAPAPDFTEPGAALMFDVQLYPAYQAVSDDIHLCLGKMERCLFAERLREVFCRDVELPEKNRSSVCLVGLKCNVNNRYLPGSVNISPLLWGMHRLLEHADRLTRENLADFLTVEAYESDMQSLDAPLLEVTQEGKVGKQLTLDVIRTLEEQIEKTYLNRVFPSEKQIDWDGAMIYRRYRTEKIKAEDTDFLRESDLSNSFFADDLHMVEQAIGSKAFGKTPQEQAVLDYITGVFAEENPQLHWMDFTRRIDLRTAWENGREKEREDFFYDSLHIGRAPLGKWPSRFMPCLMQQLAINLSWRPSADRLPIFSVNGPPGTGKTTLLKEIIAGNLVERANLLAQYTDPDDAFVLRQFQDGDKMHGGYSQYCWGYYDFADDRLKDYGMLVASCNNAAVENITKELPDGAALLKGVEPGKEEESIQEGLREVWSLFRLEEAEQETYVVWNPEKEKMEPRQYPDLYFTKLANDLAKKDEGQWDRWGLISAPFGKSSNLKEYAHFVLKPYIKNFGWNDSIQKRKDDYAKAVEQFQLQYDKVTAMERELAQVVGIRDASLQKSASLMQEAWNMEESQRKGREWLANSFGQAEKVHAQLEEAKRGLEQEEQERVLLQMRGLKQKDARIDAENQIQKLRQYIMQLEQSRRLRDVFFDLLKRPTMLSRTIEEQYQALAEIEQLIKRESENAASLQRQLEHQERKCAECMDRKAFFEREANRLQHEQFSIVNQMENLRKQGEECLRQAKGQEETWLSALREASSRSGDQAMQVLDKEFFRRYSSGNDQEATAAQTANPWYTAAYNREREKLFYQALKLHKAFLLASKACLWNFKNLLLLWGYPRDDDKEIVSVSQRDREAAFGSLFNTVFLLTPVLSTTFASAGNMLSSIRRSGEIGCLIVDEAGQAAPQMALGSLYRCRRAIVVGDPKQVEPVVTDELDLIKQVIQNDFTCWYQSKTHSVQGFADRLNPIGTTYREDGKEIWEGCPLVVHRRCISPMFELSNILSYNQIMRQQTIPPGPEKEAGFCRESSGWIQVNGSENSTAGRDHFVAEQGRAAWELIRKAFWQTNVIPSLFVITPFTSVRDGMKKMIRSQPEYETDARLQAWIEQSIGTVHTFQGKEADQVIFLLGCDRNSLPAVRWVNTNIVNVAATRAKYRFYVIGDYSVWQNSSLFQRVKEILDRHTCGIFPES